MKMCQAIDITDEGCWWRDWWDDDGREGRAEIFVFQLLRFSERRKKKNRRSKEEGEKKVNPLAYCQVIERNNMNECLYVDQVQTRTGIAFPHAIGRQCWSDKHWAVFQGMLKWHPMVAKAIHPTHWWRLLSSDVEHDCHAIKCRKFNPISKSMKSKFLPRTICECISMTMKITMIEIDVL